jgi:uncharacterized protein involved in exopolysaccharide biosynthesis
VAREELFDSIQVTHDVERRGYRLLRRVDGRYVVLDDSTGSQLATTRPGETLQLGGLSVRLSPTADRYGTIAFAVVPLDRAALGVLGGLSIMQVGRDVNVLTIEYEDTDPGLAWRVPNTIVDRYLARRREVARSEARNTVAFLREQLDTVSTQLAAAEDELRGYRQSHRAIDPRGEATSQVQRLVSMQSERASLETERLALTRLLAEVDAKAARRGLEDPTPYRDLLAFPTLLRSQIAEGLLSSLSAVEQQRSELLTRRTPSDPDVLALTDRLKDL